jgi:ABC-type bacteriocin/lantibiotic exporter with double-glycine peptidase domain
MFGLYLAASYRFVPSISKIVQSIQNIQFNLACAKNLKNEILNFNEISKIKKKIKMHENKNIFQSKIEFKNLSFSYDLNSIKENTVLKNINFEIKKGECVGIVGNSGSGKSTLTDLLIGLQTPTTGEILVDSVNINRFINNWQKLLGCVPQEVFISDDSLKKNIAFGVSETNINDKKITKCLELSNLKDFSTTLENNLETIIGERGARLSGGQKQRIGIARAFYNNPEILIFDESTNSLDSETESKILSEIYNLKKEKTIIIISHKKNILKKCDYILAIENKTIKKMTRQI